MRTRLIAILVFALLAVPAAAQASPRQIMSFEAPTQLLDDTQRDVTLRQIRTFGVTYVRQIVYWRSFAPRPRAKRKPRFDARNPGAYPAGTWTQLDRLVQAARERGVKLFFTLSGPVPRWATKSKKNQVDRPNARQFGHWATAVGRRYGADIGLWSIWNEPNHPDFLGPQYVDDRPYSPKLYRSLYRAGYKALRRIDSNRRDKILIGETAPRGNDNVVFPLAFLRNVACLNRKYKKTRKCSRLPADGYAHHAYTTRTGPRWVSPEEDEVTIGVLSRLSRALDKAGKAAGLPRRLPIYLTEFGIQSFPDTRSGVALARQPAYQAISEHIAYVNPRVKWFSQYLMRDDFPRDEGYRFGGFESGLMRSDGRPKPSFRAFANPLAVENYGDSDVLWGLIRPQRRVTRVTIEIKRTKKSKWKVLRRLRTTSTGVYSLTVAHRKKQRYRVRWQTEGGRKRVGPPIRSY
jgi:hypothetical protein